MTHREYERLAKAWIKAKEVGEASEELTSKLEKAAAEEIDAARKYNAIPAWKKAKKEVNRKGFSIKKF